MTPSKLTDAFRRAVRRQLRVRGFDIVRFEPSRVPELRRRSLVDSRGITVVLDVGANDGPFARDLRAAGYHGRIVSFEPQRAAFEGLVAAAAGDALWETRRLALGASEGERPLHVSRNSSSSSLLAMGERHLASAPESVYVADELVPVARLDSLRDELVRPTDRVYLKVDVQGFELEVLRGAAELLSQTEIVDVELSLTQLYEGAPLLGEVVEHLDAAGFAPLWLEPVFVDPATGRLLQLDGLFGRMPDYPGTP